MHRVARNLVLSCLSTLAIVPSLVMAANPTEQAVLAPIQALFDGMARYDKNAILAEVQPEGSVALLREGKVVRMTLAQFADHIKPSKDRIEERIHDPDVRIDDDIAMVWAPYEFLLNGKVVHCGTDVINLVHENQRWVISGIADNSRNNCPSS
ncbi:nuclear transport factor 2 family protein [Pinirhizobacter sp.]|jgi:hypothetical protein|uniref:nuclear transport factor 2 family protein n=1 Tax=Pinirhizobacter sp. TaxID=2950432 RepID=UPI002F40E5C0